MLRFGWCSGMKWVKIDERHGMLLSPCVRHYVVPEKKMSPDIMFWLMWQYEEGEKIIEQQAVALSRNEVITLTTFITNSIFVCLVRRLYYKVGFYFTYYYWYLQTYQPRKVR